MAMFPGDHAYPAPPSRDLSLMVPYEGDFVDKSGRRLEKNWTTFRLWEARFDGLLN